MPLLQLTVPQVISIERIHILIQQILDFFFEGLEFELRASNRYSTV
jgi:hypothetical protein